MLVHLKLGDRSETISNVTLRDGFLPLVDGVCQSNSDANDAFNIDSALWYKALILESVYIDCDDRQVYWIRKSNTLVKTINDGSKSQRFVPKGAQKLYTDVDVYDFDPTVDELTDLAHETMTLYGRNDISWEGLCSRVTRMLHVYIFPSIKFSKDDKVALKLVYRMIEINSGTMETEILRKSTLVQITDVSQQTKLNRIIKNENFESELYVRSCNKAFLALLYADVERQVSKLTINFENYQRDVNECKKLESETSQDLLENLRKQRDESHDQLTNMTHVRETLRTVLFRNTILKKRILRNIKILPNLFHEQYMKQNVYLKQQREDLKKSCLRKVKISTAREAIKTALAELETTEVEYITAPSTDGSEFSLSIGVNNKPEEWYTLEENINSLLENVHSNVYLRHNKSCDLIHDIVKRANGEVDMFASSDNVVINSDKSAKSNSTFYTSQPVESMEADMLRSMLNDMGKSIKTEIKSMCDLLLENLPNYNSNHWNKVWISYETVFYMRTLASIRQLYYKTYAKKCINLYKKVKSLSLEEVLLDDKIVNLVIEAMNSHSLPSALGQRPISRVTIASEFEMLSVPEEDYLSSTSRNRNMYTPEQFYSMADRDCEQMSGSIADMVNETTHLNNDDYYEDEVTLRKNQENVDTPSVENKDCVMMEEDVECSSILGEEYQRHRNINVFLDDIFLDVKTIIRSLFKSTTILRKLRRVTKILRSLHYILSNIAKNMSIGCCDDMLSMVVMLLYNLDEDTFVELYYNIILLIDLQAPFFLGGVHDCSLTNFYSAFNFLFSNQLCYVAYGTDDVQI